MKRAALLLALFAVTAPLLAQDPAPDEDRLLAAAAESRDAFVAIPLYDEFLRRFPDSPQVEAALFWYLQLSRRTPETRLAALERLRWAEKEGHGWRGVLAGRYRWFVEELAGWRFKEWPGLVRPGDRVRIWGNRHEVAGPARRSFRISFVPPDAERRALLSAGPARDEIPLPPREEWEEVLTWAPGPEGVDYLDVPFTKPGTWVVEETADGLTAASTVEVRDWLVLARGVGEDGIVWASSLDRPAPIPGVKVTIRQESGLTEGVTGPDGAFRFRRNSDATVAAERDDEVLGARLESPWYDEEDRAEATAPKRLVYITTDRPVYRPGQEVSFRAVRRDLADDALSVPQSAEVRVELRDPQGRLVAHRTETWDADGVIAGSFPIATEPPLGGWTILVHEPAPWCGRAPDSWDIPEDLLYLWRRTFRVEEYRKPELTVAFEPAPPAADGRPRARIRATYYTGEPAAGARVEWWAEGRFPEETARPRPLDGHPLSWFFTRRPQFVREWDYGDDAWYEAAGDGEGTTGADGTILVDLLPEDPDALRYLEDAESFRVHAMVTGASRLAVEASGTIARAGRGERAVLEVPAAWVSPGEDVTGRVVVRDSAGDPVPGREVEVRGLAARNLDAGIEYEEDSRLSLVTGDDGSAPFRLPAPAAGALRVLARAAGSTAADRREVVVASPAGAELPWRGSADSRTFDLLPDRVVYEDGDTARILVRSSLYRAAGLLLVEADGIVSSRPVVLEGPVDVLEVRLAAGLAPNAQITLMAANREGVTASTFEILVFPRDRMLTVEAEAERAEYAPGDDVTVRVGTRDAAGAPVEAVVELAIVDESVFAVVADRTEDLRPFFFPFRDTYPDLSDPPGSVSFVQASWRPEVMYEGEAVFGKAEEAEPMLGGDGEGAPAPVRRRFADTMLYAARVRTGPDGTATVALKAPGNLAKWRIVARAVAGADRFGVATGTTVTRKDVTVRIAAPRFYTVRDEGVVGTVVRSELPEAAEFTVRLTGEGLVIGGEPQTVRLEPGAEAVLDWPVKATEPGTARLRAEAVSSVMSDGMEITVPVLPHGARQQVNAAGLVDGVWSASLALPEGADRADARLVVRATTLAGSLRQALPFLAGYPYGCVEQTMSRFLPSVVASRTLARLGMSHPALDEELPKMVEDGLLRLYRFQHEDGGWGWWEHDETHPFMTAYVVFGLLTAREAGVDVDEATVAHGVEALAGIEALAPTAFGRYVLTRAGADLGDAPEIEPEDVEDEAYLTLAGRRGLLARYSPPRQANGKTIRTAALVLRALAASAPDDPRAGGLVSWLLASRRGGAWISTLDSAYAVLALAEAASRPGAVTAKVTVNGRAVPVDGGRAEVAGDALVVGENRIEVEREGEGSLFASAALSYVDAGAEGLAPMEGAFLVERTFMRVLRDEDGYRYSEAIESGAKVSAGEEILVTLTVTALEPSEFVMIECPLPAGAEAWPDEEEEEYWWDSWYQRRELRDDRVAVAGRELDGAEEFTFRLRTTLPGNYHVMPARAFAMYEPEEAGRSDEFLLIVTPR